MGEILEEYPFSPLDLGDLDPDPFAQFERWLASAVEMGIHQPHAFVLATTGEDGQPSARALLLKGFSPEGLLFFSNYESRKGRELAANPRAAAVFVWTALHRQVRMEGVVVRVDPATSDAYFSSRPLGARLAAAVSPQSRVVGDRRLLEAALAKLALRHPDGDVPRPDHWGGYRLQPALFEFWQGQPDRFHDRFRYRRAGGYWVVERLAP
jgi:pyridoxamine 5'-phosphate oxidase